MLTNYYIADPFVESFRPSASEEQMLGRLSVLRNWMNAPMIFPKINLSDIGNAFLLVMLVPGMDMTTLDVSLVGGRLTIQGRMEPDPERDHYLAHIRERLVGRFHRCLLLPGTVDYDQTEIIYRNGVLTVILKKAD